ncbi:MAG: hypothetical protein RI904_2021, partial [Pseudomonadota bacterium]
MANQSLFGTSIQLTGAQQNIWFHQQLDPNSAAYQLSYYAEIEGQLDPERLSDAIDYTVTMLDPLRLVFFKNDGKPLQRVQPSSSVRLVVIDLTSTSDSRRNARIQIDELQAQPLFLEDGIVCKFALYKLAETKWIWQFVIHHICIDGVVTHAYRKKLNKNDAATDRTKVSSTSWEQAVHDDIAYTNSEQTAVDKEFWQHKLSGLELPVSMNPAQLNPLYIDQPHRVFRELSRNAYTELIDCGRRVCGSAYSLFSSATLIYLSRLCGTDDVSINVPTSGRNKQSRSTAITLANQVPLRVRVQPHQTVQEILISSANELLEGLEHNKYPAREIYRIAQQQGLPAAASVCINVVNMNYFADFGTAKGSFHMNGTAPTADVTLIIWDQRDNGPVRFSFEYNSERYSAQQAQNHLDNLVHLFCSIPTCLDRPVAEVPVYSAEKYQTLLSSSAGPNVAQDDDSLTSLFKRCAQAHPSSLAVIHKDKSVRYEDLVLQSDEVARQLQQIGLKPGMIAAVMLEPSIPMVATILGIMKIGAAYLPIDLSYPEARINYIVQDSKADLLLGHAEQIETFLSSTTDKTEYREPITIDSGSTQVLVRRSLEPTSKPSAFPIDTALTAYVIYTSGSTGAPKGVAVPHRGVVNMVRAQINIFDIGPADRVLQFASLGFDASVSEIFTAICSGATLVLPTTNDRTELSAKLADLCDEFNITHATIPPALLLTLPHSSLRSLKTLIVAGEACPHDAVVDFAGQRKMLNAYGPTESSVCATISAPLDPIQDGQSREAPVSIGLPIWNTQIYILDQSLQPVPAGNAGELYIAGNGLARGYVNRPGLSAERFIANPFSTSPSRMYRTGDLARRRPDGAIEYLGRVDDQVKIRGFRIELGEIESALLSEVASLAQVAVIARAAAQQTDKRLVAYLVAHEGQALPSSEEIRAALAQRLPDYMVPSAFVTL